MSTRLPLESSTRQETSYGPRSFEKGGVPSIHLLQRSAAALPSTSSESTPEGTEAHDLLTIDEDLSRLESNSISEHGYLDERWKGHERGQAPMQLRARELFAILAGANLDRGTSLLRRTPTSNVILLRSRDVDQLEREHKANDVDIASRCWPFHRAVIEVAQPQVVLAHAVKVVRRLAKRWNLGKGQQRPSGQKRAKLYAWRLAEGPRLLAIPNLSRYKPDGARAGALRVFFEEFAPEILTR